MKKILIIVIALLMCSCGSVKKTIIPKAINTVATAFINDLRLQRSDYEILDAVTAEAMVSYSSDRRGEEITIKGIDEDFELEYSYDKDEGWECEFSGIVKLGYLNNDYSYSPSEIASPEDLARRLAIYRAINEVRRLGGDGLIEPTISTNVEQVNDDTVIFKSIVTAKIIKIKKDSEL